VWLGNARLRAAQEISARAGWVQTRKVAPFARAQVHSGLIPVEEESGHLWLHPPSSGDLTIFETLNGEIDIYAVMLL
jgi:hypothetical protein